MTYRIFWTPIAVQDLRDICDFISWDELVAAQRMGEELIKQSEAMAAFPMSGRVGSAATARNGPIAVNLQGANQAPALF